MVVWTALQQFLDNSEFIDELDVNAHVKTADVIIENMALEYIRAMKTK